MGLGEFRSESIVFYFILTEWNEQALSAMRHLHTENAVLTELIEQFEAAEAWLAPMRP